MSEGDHFNFDTPEDFINYLEEKAAMQEADFQIGLPQRDMPDNTLTDKASIAAVIAAVAVILGVDLSDEKLAAITLLVTVGVGAAQWADTRRRQHRNESLAITESAAIDASIRYGLVSQDVDEDE